MQIKSLPQDWLWCETWCDNESKKTAKTIDLCNNPQTKEPKLSAARRILPEWEGYDNEIKALMERVYHKDSISSKEGKKGKKKHKDEDRDTKSSTSSPSLSHDEKHSEL